MPRPSPAGTIIPPGAEPSRSAYLLGITLFGALPIALIVRDPHVVATFSTASVGFVYLFGLVILTFALVPTAPHAVATTAAAAGASTPGLLLWNMDGLLTAFPVMAYSFTAHPYYMGVYTQLAQPSTARMMHVTDLAMVASALLYCAVGVGGYVTFRHRTAGKV